MTESQRNFAERIVRRKRLFIILSIAGVVGGAAVGGYAMFRWLNDPSFDIAPRLVIAVLILLNSRQNLRQYRVATILESGARASRLPGAPTTDHTAAGHA